MKMRLTLEVDYIPNGETEATLRRHMGQVVTDAVNNGTLTGEGPAEVDEYRFDVEVVPELGRCPCGEDH